MGRSQETTTMEQSSAILTSPRRQITKNKKGNVSKSFATKFRNNLASLQSKVPHNRNSRKIRTTPSSIKKKSTRRATSQNITRFKTHAKKNITEDKGKRERIKEKKKDEEKEKMNKSKS